MRRKYECFANTICTLLQMPPLKVRYRAKPIPAGQSDTDALYSEKWDVLYINENTNNVRAAYEDITYEIYKIWLKQRRLSKTESEMRTYARQTVLKLFGIAL